jgi:hypothetical protein
MALVFVLAACGGKGSNNKQPDGPPPQMDAPPMVPAMITISGTASAPGLGAPTPVQGAVVAAYKTGTTTSPIAMATTDANGNYSITITTNGMVVDGYLKATKATYVDTYLYPPRPLAMDFSKGSINMLTSGMNGTFQLLSTLAQGNQMPGNGLIALEVFDATNTAVMGATVSSTPAANPYRYDGTSGRPDATVTSTGADGVAYMFNLPATGTVMVSATKTGTAFHSHSLPAVADSLTTTLITP